MDRSGGSPMDAPDLKWHDRSTADSERYEWSAWPTIRAVVTRRRGCSAIQLDRHLIASFDTGAWARHDGADRGPGAPLIALTVRCAAVVPFEIGCIHRAAS